MGTILEHLQTQRDNVVVVVNQGDATIVTSIANATLVLMYPTDPGVQPTTVIQSLSQSTPSRFVAPYPWGMPHIPTTLSFLLETCSCKCECCYFPMGNG